MIGPAIKVDADEWRHATQAIAAGRRTLVALWGGVGHVLMATRGPGDLGILQLDCPDGAFPSVAARHPPAIRLERTMRDLYGLSPLGAPDERPWLDHRRWAVRHPLGRAQATRALTPYPFLAADGDGLHQVAVGPVHAGVIEPGQFLIHASGETVVRLEERLGFVHRGLEARMIGADLAQASRLAGRASGDSTVAYSLAFARAVEGALGIEAPPRAQWLRALMAELERLANHIGDIGAICNDAAFGLMHAHCAALREQALRAAAAAFGHRLMMDRVVPGGVALDLETPGVEVIRRFLAHARERLPRLVSLYDDTASLQDRTVGTGVVPPELAGRYGAGGFVGRACGVAFDARKAFPYAPYDQLDFEVPTRTEGDVNARVWVRIEEASATLGLIGQILDGLPAGAATCPVPEATGEGAALVEGFRGDVFAWVRLAGGQVESAHLRDPSWFQWPLLEAAIEGAIVADFPLCNKSFNCSYAGVDL
ncbi:MAG TPA: nickel-dependent hydrogenase large subunit [Caulobacteraceae bacterium]|nr:nickel-dependent hydrogenase large subunit [Caulobacteraceae bacterium]